MEYIKINGRSVRAADVDFNFVASLAENGIQLNEMGKKMIPTVRVYVAHCMNMDVETAGDMIQAHIVNGGSMADIVSVFSKKCEESDFFRAISESTAESLEQSEVKEVESKKVTKISKKQTTEVNE